MVRFSINLFSQNVSSSKYVQTVNVRPQKFLSLDGATLQKLIIFFMYLNMNTMEILMKQIKKIVIKIMNHNQ